MIYTKEINTDNINNFIEFRKAFGYTGYEIAEFIVKRAQTVYWYDKNPSKMSDMVLNAIAKNTGVDIEDIKAIRDRAVEEIENKHE